MAIDGKQGDARMVDRWMLALGLHGLTDLLNLLYSWVVCPSGDGSPSNPTQGSKGEAKGGGRNELL